MLTLGAGPLVPRLKPNVEGQNYRACTKIVLGSRHIYGLCPNMTECGRQAGMVHLVEDAQRTG